MIRTSTMDRSRREAGCGSMWISSRRMASPVSATGSPGFTIDWSVDGPDATGASLRAVPGTRDSIEYRPPADYRPPAGARGRVVVRAGVAERRLSRRSTRGGGLLCRVPTQDCGTGTAHSPGVRRRQRVGRVPAGVDRRPGGRNRLGVSPSPEVGPRFRSGEQLTGQSQAAGKAGQMSRAALAKLAATA